MLHKLRSAQILIWLFLLFLPNASVHGADATSFDPTRVEVKAKGSGGVPVGMILAWPVGQNPEDMDNWLECNGQSISPSAYPELFALVGAKVPDFRGLFLRGHGAQTSSHYGMVTHQSGALGQLQGDATRNIIGHVGDVMTSGSAEVGNYTGAFYVTHHTPNSIGYGGIYSREHISSAFDASRVVPTAEEIRPVNRAVRYLMRALP